MAKYRKKPVVIEAVQFVALTLSTGLFRFDEYPNPDWIQTNIDNGTIFYSGTGTTIIIDTLEGKMTCGMGDYIIKGVKGELYPCRSDIFEQTYKRVRKLNR